MGVFLTRYRRPIILANQIDEPGISQARPAGPSVASFAQEELGVGLDKVRDTASRGRITHEKFQGR